MRVERLTSENPRTQGAVRRAQYRRHSPAHLDTIAHLIRRGLAVRTAPAPRAAVILGAGAGTELPLASLARALDTILLVDLDLPGMERARAELPASLRPRVRALPADLSGGVSQTLAALLRAQPWDDLARLAGPTAAAPLDAAAAQNFRRRVAHAHLSLLDALLAPGGAGVLISDVTGHLLPARSGPHAAPATESLPVLPPDVLDLPRDLAARFTLTDPTRAWRWIVEPPHGETPGRAYDVFGAVFTKLGPSSAS